MGQATVIKKAQPGGLRFDDPLFGQDCDLSVWFFAYGQGVHFRVGAQFEVNDPAVGG
jgi:hypothetical protein